MSIHDGDIGLCDWCGDDTDVVGPLKPFRELHNVAGEDVRIRVWLCRECEASR